MSDNKQNNVTYLIESRYWMLNAKLLKEDLTPADFSEILKSFDGSILNGENLKAEIARHPLDNYTEVTSLLKFTVGEDVLSQLSEKFLFSRQGVKLAAIEMWVTDLELLCCYVVFMLDPAVNIKEFEKKEMSIVDILSSLQPDLEKVFHLLAIKKVISIHDGFLFGVPDILGKEGLHNPDNSYLYTWHLFFPNNPDKLKETVSDYNFEDNYINYAGGKVYTGWGIILWEPIKELSISQMIDCIFIDSIASSESVVYYNSINCFTGFLDLIIQKKRVDCNYIRNICNTTHLILQHIKQWNKNLSVEQEEYHERLRKVLKQDIEKADYDSAEAILKNAVEGVEVNESQKSGRTIEMVLSFFTALSLYSVTTDIYTIITTESTVAPIHPLSIRTFLILFATITVLLFFLFLRRERKK
jgi:hypothetical protein